MAKKKFNIGSTLKKNQSEEALPAKVPLGKRAKDIQEVKEIVDQIHDGVGEEAAPVVDPITITKEAAPKSQATIKSTPVDTPAPRKRGRPKKSELAEPIKLVRLTIDTPPAMHRKLKIRAIEEGVSMRDYVLTLLEKALK